MADGANDPNGPVDVYFHKSAFFRVVHADGCFGGLTPRGYIHCAFYSERQAIPLRAEIQLQNGLPQSEKVTETKGGLVRELETDVFMDFTTAMSFHVWFRDKLEALRGSMGISDADWTKMLSSIK